MGCFVFPFNKAVSVPLHRLFLCLIGIQIDRNPVFLLSDIVSIRTRSNRPWIFCALFRVQAINERSFYTMAERRMIARNILFSNNLQALSVESRYLYVLLISEADDDGFVSS
jgi:hypothetical protein